MAALEQWQNFQRNFGEWQGSFTRLSPQGDIQQETPSRLVLENLDPPQTARLTLQFLHPQTRAVEQERILDYTPSTFGSNILFFETGAFSQGSLQYSPVAQFGSEFGFVMGDRRLRLVQLFSPGGSLTQLTLIREQRANTTAPERPPLNVDDLLGTWTGEAVTLYSDWRSPERYPSQLSLDRLDQNQLRQTLQTPTFSLTSQGAIAGSTLTFTEGPIPIQVLLLPDGASSTTPLDSPRGHPFFLEAGWLLNSHQRQRLIRSYDAQGAWTSLTFITEAKAS
jgi:hypothetical protein